MIYRGQPKAYKLYQVKEGEERTLILVHFYTASC
jgi:hypothetical protein